EQPYFANTPQGRVLIPADWDSLEMDSPRIGVYAESIGARADIAEVEVEAIEQPEEIVEVEQPEAVEVAEEHPMVALVPAEEIDAQPGVVPAEQPKDEQPKAEPKAEAKAQVKVEDVQAEEVKPAKAEAPKQVNNQVNIAAIIGGVVAALAALGIGAAFLAMR
ncbi:hypothetical protein ACFPRI_07155, partial [Corynebacterium pilbarense]